jgi:uncharacterized protein (TIGR02246 family)
LRHNLRNTIERKHEDVPGVGSRDHSHQPPIPDDEEHVVATAASRWGNSTEILRTAGVTEDESFYDRFSDPDERAALTMPQLVAAAWADNDADAFANLFTEDGSELIGDEQMRSREEIRAFMLAGFAGPYRGSKVKGWPLHVKFLTDDVALLVTGGGVVMPGESAVAPDRELRSTWVVVRGDNGRIRLHSHQSSPVRN